MAILYLTSGATGEPKMAMVTHQAIVSNIDMGPAVLPLGPQDRTVAFLPSAHIAQRVVIEFLPSAVGHAGPLLGEPAQAAAGYPLRQADPAAGAAANVGANLLHDLHGTAQTSGRRAEVVLWRASALGLAAARYRHQGKAVPARISVPLRLADRMLFRKVRARFGGQIGWRLPARRR